MILKKIDLIVGYDNLEYEEDGAVFGNIYFRCENLYFPHESWTDYIIRILNTWFEDIINLQKYPTYTANLFFFDGPYVFEIKRNNMAGTLLFIEEYDHFKKKKIVFSADIDVDYFCLSYFDCVKKTLDYLESIPNKERDYNLLKDKYLLNNRMSN